VEELGGAVGVLNVLRRRRKCFLMFSVFKAGPKAG